MEAMKCGNVMLYILGRVVSAMTVASASEKMSSDFGRKERERERETNRDHQSRSADTCSATYQC